MLRSDCVYEESKTSQYYSDYTLMLVGRNEEGELAALTFKFIVQNLQKRFHTALKTAMISDLKLYAINSENWFYYYHLFLECIRNCFCALHRVISNQSRPAYVFLSTIESRGGKSIMNNNFNVLELNNVKNVRLPIRNI